MFHAHHTDTLAAKQFLSLAIGRYNTISFQKPLGFWLTILPSAKHARAFALTCAMPVTAPLYYPKSQYAYETLTGITSSP